MHLRTFTSLFVFLRICMYGYLSFQELISLLYHIIYKAIICTKKVFSGESYGTYGYNKQDKFVFVGRSAFDTFAWGRNISEHKAWISTDTHFKNNEEKIITKNGDNLLSIDNIKEMAYMSIATTLSKLTFKKINFVSFTKTFSLLYKLD